MVGEDERALNQPGKARFPHKHPFPHVSRIFDVVVINSMCPKHTPPKILGSKHDQWDEPFRWHIERYLKGCSSS